MNASISVVVDPPVHRFTPVEVVDWSLIVSVVACDSRLLFGWVYICFLSRLLLFTHPEEGLI